MKYSAGEIGGVRGLNVQNKRVRDLLPASQPVKLDRVDLPQNGTVLPSIVELCLGNVGAHPKGIDLTPRPSAYPGVFGLSGACPNALAGWRRTCGWPNAPRPVLCRILNWTLRLCTRSVHASPLTLYPSDTGILTTADSTGNTLKGLQTNTRTESAPPDSSTHSISASNR